MTYHFMPDLETIGVSNRAAILQIGWVVFNPESARDDIVQRMGFNVNLDDCMKLGGELTDDSVRWWLRQSDAARASVSRPGLSLIGVLQTMIASYQGFPCERVWSHGASFDIPIVEHYLRALGLKAPWRYSEVRDTRTLFELALAQGWSRPSNGLPTAHEAMADAVCQAQDVRSAWRWLADCVRPAPVPSPMFPAASIVAVSTNDLLTPGV